MKISLKREIFIPNFNGNKDLPEANRITVAWKYPTPIERTQIKNISPYRFDLAGKIENIIEYQINQQKLIEFCVVKINNLEVEDRKIETGIDLNNTEGLGELFEEIANFLIPKLSEVDQKN